MESGELRVKSGECRYVTEKETVQEGDGGERGRENLFRSEEQFDDFTFGF